MTNVEHITRLASHGACIRSGENTAPLTVDFYEAAVAKCKNDGYNAMTYDLVLPGIDDEMGLCIWCDGHVDSGSMRAICDCLAAR